MDEIKETISQAGSKSSEPAFIDASDPNEFSRAVRKEISAERQAEINAQKKYEQDALLALNLQGQDMTQKGYDAVVREATKNWARHTGNPELDARMNFLEARVRIREQQLNSRKNPLSKNDAKDVEGLGGESGTRMVNRSASNPPVDPELRSLYDHLDKVGSKVHLK
jgi:hypothetical protein